jgi:peptide/nickel transport system ATP-binding protein
MYLGQVVEHGPVARVYGAPAHPYTKALLASMPSMDPEARTLEPPITGDPPSPIDPPEGCRFHTRCPFAEAVCGSSAPRAMALATDDHVACHMADRASGHSRAGKGAA